MIIISVAKKGVGVRTQEIFSFKRKNFGVYGEPQDEISKQIVREVFSFALVIMVA